MTIADILQPLHDHIAAIEAERDAAYLRAEALRALVLGIVPAAERILQVAQRIEAEHMPTGAPAWVDEGHETLPIGLEPREGELIKSAPKGAAHSHRANPDPRSEEWARRLASGETAGQIAPEYGVAWQKVAMNAKEWRKHHGEPAVEPEPEPEPQPTARRRAAGKPARSADEIAEWRRLKEEEGLSYREIAGRVGVSRTRVWTWLNKGDEPEPVPDATEAASDHQVSAGEAAPEPPRMVTMCDPEPEPAAPDAAPESDPEVTRCIIGTLTNGRRFCREECDAKRGCHLPPDGSCDQCMWYDDADLPCACWQPATPERLEAFETWLMAQVPARAKVPGWNGRG